MPTVESTYTVATTAPGREDYSASVEISPVPVIRGYQQPARYDHTFEDVAVGATDVHEAGEFDLTHLIFNAWVSASAMVDIYAELYSYHPVDGWLLAMFNEGYQMVRFNMPFGYPISRLKVEVTNYGDVPINIVYSHVGLMGLERIYPTYQAGEPVW